MTGHKITIREEHPNNKKNTKMNSNPQKFRWILFIFVRQGTIV